MGGTVWGWGWGSGLEAGRRQHDALPSVHLRQQKHHPLTPGGTPGGTPNPSPNQPRPSNPHLVWKAAVATEQSGRGVRVRLMTWLVVNIASQVPDTPRCSHLQVTGHNQYVQLASTHQYTSLKYISPPGASTRYTSRSTAALSGDRLI